MASVTLIGKSWKTHPEKFPKFQFSGSWARPGFEIVHDFCRDFEPWAWSYCWKTHPSKFYENLFS